MQQVTASVRNWQKPVFIAAGEQGLPAKERPVRCADPAYLAVDGPFSLPPDAGYTTLSLSLENSSVSIPGKYLNPWTINATPFAAIQ